MTRHYLDIHSHIDLNVTNAPYYTGKCTIVQIKRALFQCFPRAPHTHTHTHTSELHFTRWVWA